LRGFCVRPKHVFECKSAVESADLHVNAVGAQQIAYPTMGAHDAQRNVASGELAMQFVNHAGSREIDKRRS
jgi:hypothetical protein